MTDKTPSPGIYPGLPQVPMNLVDFAKTAKLTDGPHRFIEMMRAVLPLEELRNLTEGEALMFHSAVTWLFDYSLLLTEFHSLQGQAPSPDCSEMAPVIPGSHCPFILNCLTRGYEAPDFSQLENFGLEGRLP